MTNREEQIYKAADKATYQTPPQYSELVHKSRKVMCAYETGFIDGCVWADSQPQWIPVEEELPKEENAYLVSDGDGVLYGYFIEGRWAPTELNETCTHWMPLPKAPRKEE